MKKSITQFGNFTTLLLAVFMLLTSIVSAQTTHEVNVIDTEFDPANITIKAGDQVTWTNSMGYHSVNGTQTSYPSNPESFFVAEGTGWTYDFTFTTPGFYEYHCDPHIGLGMKGTVTVIDEVTLTVSFSGMNPHVGQDLWLAVIDQETGKEFGRVKTEAAIEFDVVVPGIETGRSYHVDFYADHNGNGKYDAPPTDHAWRMELNDVMEDALLEFTHNTNFTDVDWNHKLTVEFSGMSPHVGQLFELYLYNTTTESYVDTFILDEITSVDFDVASYNIEPGSGYNIDFFADLNGNGMYDAPNTDHAWRITLDEVMGDTVIEFSHNVDFTNIFETTSIIRTNLADGSISLYPNPAAGQLHLSLGDQMDGERTVEILNTSGRVVYHAVVAPDVSNSVLQIESLVQGIYFVVVQSEKRQAVEKFLKLE